MLIFVVAKQPRLQKVAELLASLIIQVMDAEMGRE
jgi:hypothetical protein